MVIVLPHREKLRDILKDYQTYNNICFTQVSSVIYQP